MPTLKEPGGGFVSNPPGRDSSMPAGSSQDHCLPPWRRPTVGRSTTEAFRRALHTTLRQTINEETRELVRLTASSDAEDYEPMRAALGSARGASEKLRIDQETKSWLKDPRFQTDSRAGHSYRLATYTWKRRQRAARYRLEGTT